MALTVANIITGRARVYYGGTILNDPDAVLGCYWDTNGIDIGCTDGGIQIAYEAERQDVFCDQSLTPVTSFISAESVEISFTMRELNIENLQRAIENTTLTSTASAKCLDVGGDTSFVPIPLKVEVDFNDASGRRFVYTFFMVRSTGGLDVTYGERENPAQADVTFTAFADTTKPAGQQLFSVVELT